MMGGTISVESEPGKGSVFRFTFAAPTSSPDAVAALRIEGARPNTAAVVGGHRSAPLDAAGTDEIQRHPSPSNKCAGSGLNSTQKIRGQPDSEADGGLRKRVARRALAQSLEEVTITHDLPASPLPQSPALHSGHSCGEGASTRSDSPNTPSRLPLLCVDDNPTNLRVLKVRAFAHQTVSPQQRMLELLGYKAVCVDGGQAALSLMEVHSVAALVLHEGLCLKFLAVAGPERCISCSALRLANA